MTGRQPNREYKFNNPLTASLLRRCTGSVYGVPHAHAGRWKLLNSGSFHDLDNDLDEQVPGLADVVFQIEQVDA